MQFNASGIGLLYKCEELLSIIFCDQGREV